MTTKAEYFQAAKRDYESVDIQIVGGPEADVLITSAGAWVKAFVYVSALDLLEEQAIPKEK